MDFSKISEPFKKSYASLKTAGLQFINHQKNLSLSQHFSEYQTANNAESLGALKQAGTFLKSMIQIKGMTEKIKQIPANFILSQLIPNTQITPLKQMRLEAAKNQQEAYQAGQAVHQKLTKIWNMKGEDLLASASNKLNHAILETTLPLLNPSPQIRGEATGALKFEIATWFVGMGEVKAASKAALVVEKGILSESTGIAEAGLKIFTQTQRKILPATEELILKSVVGSTERGIVSSLKKTAENLVLKLPIPKDGALRAAQFSKHWQNASLKEVAEKLIGKNQIWIPSPNGQKMIARNINTGIEIAYDLKGKYFTVVKKMGEEFVYFGKNGEFIPKNVFLIKVTKTTMTGLAKDIRKGLSHFNNTDEVLPWK